MIELFVRGLLIFFFTLGFISGINLYLYLESALVNIVIG